MNKIFLSIILTLLLCFTFNKSDAQYVTWDMPTLTDTLTFQLGQPISPYSSAVFNSGEITGMSYDDPTFNNYESVQYTIGYYDSPVPSTGPEDTYNILYIVEGIENYIDDAVGIISAELQLTALGNNLLDVDDTTDMLIGVWRLFEPFDPETATYNNRMTGITWNTAGARDYSGTWTNIFGGTGATSVPTQWNCLNDSWARPTLAAAAREFAAGSDTLGATHMTGHLDRMFFADEHTPIHPFKTGASGSNGNDIVIRINMKRLVEGWCLYGWENYGCLIGAQQIVGTVGSFAVAGTAAATPQTKPKLVVIYQKAVPSSGSGSGTGGGGVVGAGSQGYR